MRKVEPKAQPKVKQTLEQVELDHEQTCTSGPRGIRREEGTVYDRADTNGPATARPEGSGFGPQPQRIDRAVRAGVCQLQPAGEAVGGIVRQLMAKADNQLAQVEKDLNQLGKTRSQLEQDREMLQRNREQLQMLLEALQQTEREILEEL
jgi:hypothetical protein